jgi:hypothetical protein
MGGSATNGTDYNTISGSKIIPSGSSYVNILLTPINDSSYEGSETATLTISTQNYYDRGTSYSADIAISDDESPPLPTVTVSATDASASESGGTGNYRISRTGSTSAGLTVYYSMGGSATNGTDYNTISGSKIIPSGSSYVNILLTPINDSSYEGSETATLTISTQNYYDRGTSYSASITIQDIVATLSHIQVSGPTTVEENSGESYICMAFYNDGSQSDVSSSAIWSENSDYATIGTGGHLSTSPVITDENIAITATYGGKSNIYNVIIKNMPVTLSYVRVGGVSPVPELSTAPYKCRAYYSDGTQKDISNSAYWSVNAEFVSIDNGMLWTGSVDTNTWISVTASFGGKSDSQDVYIKDVVDSIFEESKHDISMLRFDDSEDIKIADLDNDGDLDILFGYHEGGGTYCIYYLKNNNNMDTENELVLISRGFSCVSTIEAVDLDDDNDLDIVVTCDYDSQWHSNLYWIEQDRINQNWSTHEIDPDFEKADHLAIFDFNDDGHFEIIASAIEDRGELRVYKRTQDGLNWVYETLFTDEVKIILTRDMNNDGWTDIIFNTWGSVFWIENDKGVLSADNLQKIADFDKTHCIDIADFDGDNDLDILATLLDPTYKTLPLRLYINESNAQNFSQMDLPLIPSGKFNRLIDVNLDNKLDIISWSSGINLYMNTGGNQYQKNTIVYYGWPDYRYVYTNSIRDYNKDGFPDILILDEKQRKIISYTNTLIAKGDVDANRSVDLVDVIKSLSIGTGEPAIDLHLEGDADLDGKIGLIEAIMGLLKSSEK